MKQKKPLSISKETIKWLDDDSLEHVHASAYKFPADSDQETTPC